MRQSLEYYDIFFTCSKEIVGNGNEFNQSATDSKYANNEWAQ